MKEKFKTRINVEWVKITILKFLDDIGIFAGIEIYWEELLHGMNQKFGLVYQKFGLRINKVTTKGIRGRWNDNNNNGILLIRLKKKVEEIKVFCNLNLQPQLIVETIDYGLKKVFKTVYSEHSNIFIWNVNIREDWGKKFKSIWNLIKWDMIEEHRTIELPG